LGIEVAMICAVAGPAQTASPSVAIATALACFRKDASFRDGTLYRFS
jgi:hypothetical protein